MKVAIVHDYLTQRGGAERVVLSMLKAFPDAPVYTALYEQSGTYPEFLDREIIPSSLNRLPVLRRRHRLALPVLATTFSSMRIDADVVVCSSSGWAHGVNTTAPKVVYCHTPARWIYQAGRYTSGQQHYWRMAAAMSRNSLRRWDLRAAYRASAYVANSTEVRRRIADVYGLPATVIHPPATVEPTGRQQPLHISPDFFLCVARLLPYKNVEKVVTAFHRLPTERLVVVGSGPEAQRIRATAPSNVTLLQSVPEAGMRWLYNNCSAVVSASHEDFGLTPVEALRFGKPSVVLAWGGHLDTVMDGRTGILFDAPHPASIAAAIRRFRTLLWERPKLLEHALTFSEERFIRQLRQKVEQVTNSNFIDLRGATDDRSSETAATTLQRVHR